MRNRLFKMLFIAAAAAIIGVAAGSVSAQTDVSVETYALPEGTTCFLIPLQGVPDESSAGAPSVAVAVDVSASQTGEIRERSIAAVESFLKNLPAGSKVQLFTANSETESLTGGFVAADSPEAAGALDALRKHTPLGAIDLGKTLKTVGDAFPADASGEKSVVFIGRGISTSSVFNEKALGEVVSGYAAKRVTFSAFSNGTDNDNPALGIMAFQTGGCVTDPRLTDGAEAGRLLAESEKAAVYWPTAAADKIVPAELTAYPSTVPPIRSDRESFLVGSASSLPESIPLSIPLVSADGKESTLSLTGKPQASDDNNQYLYQLVQRASANNGLTLPLAGRVFLLEYKAALEDRNQEKVDLAKQALDAGQPGQAEIIASEVEKAIPENKEVQDLLTKAAADKAAFEKAEKKLDGEGVKAPPTLMDAADSNRNLISSQIKANVKVVLEDARKEINVHPEKAIQDVKLAINNVQNNQYLSDGDRAELLNTLRSNYQMLDRQNFENEKRRLTAMRNKAILDQVSSVMNQRAENQKKVEEIMKRFHSLIHEGQYTLAADVASAAIDLIDDVSLPVQAANVARLSDAWNENQYLRKYRRLRFLDVLMSVERSHIPMSDEPPILYPDAETWLALSKERKEKYSDATLFTQSDSEKKIIKALDKIVDVKIKEEEGEGASLPLQEWLNLMKKELDINIVIDQKALEDNDIGSIDNCEITQSLLGVTFRTALNLALRKYDMEFCVCKEYLFITTKDMIDSLEPGDDLWRQIYHLRYYPVSDLTMQPNSSSGGSGGMGGGSRGGSGGMGGRGGGMGGGGGWNVPAAADKRPAEAAAPTGTLAAVETDLDAKWDAYFSQNAPKKPLPSLSGTEEENAENDEKSAAKYKKDLYDFGMTLMTEVHQLTVDKKYDDAEAAIKSAIRNDLAAGWMYEALTLVLIQKGAPAKEVEQVIMSALEFNNDPVALLGVAAYLETVGSSRRALDLYREISKTDPARPEPYVRGLALAKELGDEEAQKWVVLGIASGAWEGNLIDDVWSKGLDLSREILDKMTAEGRQADAEAFEKELADAMVRDVVVEVFWTGDAEIDLAVQEPANTVCWFAQPRTAGGGILQTKTVYEKSYDDQKEGRRSKTYVCPMGFNGEYNILVSRTWGTLPQNKVTVEIVTNVGGKNEKSTVYPLELENDKALFTVVLNNGRRQDEVRQEMLTAASLMNQMQIQNDRETSEKVRQYQDRKAKADARRAAANQSYTASYQDGNKSSGGEQQNDLAAPEIKYTLGDQSGYMPIIDFVEYGAMLEPSIGITPDRRYVIISPIVEFTQPARIFSITSDEGGDSGGGGMGGSGGGRSGSSGSSGSSGRSGGMGGSSGGRSGSSGSSGGRSGGGGGRSGGW